MALFSRNDKKVPACFRARQPPHPTHEKSESRIDLKPQWDQRDPFASQSILEDDLEDLLPCLLRKVLNCG